MSEHWKTLKEIVAEASELRSDFTPEEEREMLFRASLASRLRERVTHGDAPPMCHVVVMLRPEPGAKPVFTALKNRTSEPGPKPVFTWPPSRGDKP